MREPGGVIGFSNSCFPVGSNSFVKKSFGIADSGVSFIVDLSLSSAVVLFLLLLLPFILFADLVLWMRGIRMNLLCLIGGVISLLSAMRGTVVRVNSQKSNSIVNVTIL